MSRTTTCQPLEEFQATTLREHLELVLAIVYPRDVKVRKKRLREFRSNKSTSDPHLTVVLNEATAAFRRKTHA